MKLEIYEPKPAEEPVLRLRLLHGSNNTVSVHVVDERGAAQRGLVCFQTNGTMFRWKGGAYNGITDDCDGRIKISEQS